MHANIRTSKSTVDVPLEKRVVLAPLSQEYSRSRQFRSFDRDSSLFERMDTLLSCCLHDPAKETLIYIPRFTHRLSLIKAWDIPPGRHILDIGCGQGESCLVLALTMGPSGHVTAVDNAPPDYGTPFAVGESQQYIAESTLGPRITYVRTDAPSLLQQSPKAAAYDAAVLCHSLWYFPTRESVLSLFDALATARIPRLYLAEYSVQASNASQRPHILAAQAQALITASKNKMKPNGINGDLSGYNVRAALDEASTLAAARNAGFTVRRQGRITPEESMLEGHWDARHVKGNVFRKRVMDGKLPGEAEAEILALAARVEEEMDELDRRGVATVRAMDSWWAVLELDPST